MKPKQKKQPNQKKTDPVVMRHLKSKTEDARTEARYKCFSEAIGALNNRGGRAAKRDRRSELLGWLATIIGGWNASPGNHPGRLAFDVNIEDDEQVSLHLLERYRRDIEAPLRREMETLKARLYDAGIEIQKLKEQHESDVLKLCCWKSGKQPAEFQYPTNGNPYPSNGHSA